MAVVYRNKDACKEQSGACALVVVILFKAAAAGAAALRFFEPLGARHRYFESLLRNIEEPILYPVWKSLGRSGSVW